MNDVPGKEWLAKRRNQYIEVNINANRDFQLRYPTGMPTQVPKHIKPKYFGHRTPIKMAEDAYDQTRAAFEPIGQLKQSWMNQIRGERIRVYCAG